MYPVMKDRPQTESATSEGTRDDDCKQPASEQSEDHIVNSRDGIRGAEFWRKWRTLPAA